MEPNDSYSRRFLASSYEQKHILPGLLAKKEMAPRSNRRSENLLQVKVFEDRQVN